MKKYHMILKDGNPKTAGRYMVKIRLADQPEYDDFELCFREYLGNGEWDAPYYNNPKTDKLVGWYEN